MARTSTIQLVVITDSDNETERLVSLFRSAGRVARAKRPQGGDDLDPLLATPQDLIIIMPGQALPPEQALQQCRQVAPLVSAIVVTDEPVGPWFKAGAADVIAPGDDERLASAGLREVEQVRLRYRLEQLYRQLEQAEERNALLLAESDDAVAYIGDGMIIHANDRFAERFGFASADDLDCTSIVDLITAADVDKVKAMLKALASSGEACEFAFEGQHADGTTFQASMQLSASNYDGEDCTQLSVRELGSGTGAGASIDIDPLTGLASRQRLDAELAALLTQLTQSAGQASLVYFGIDDFPAARTRLGLSAALELTRSLAGRLAALTERRGLLAAWGDDGFVWLLGECHVERAAELAQQCLTGLAAEGDAGVGRGGCTLSAGAVGLTVSETGPTLLDQAFRSAQQLREESGGNGVRIHKPSLQQRAAGSADDFDRALEEALEDGQFTLLFQPLISLRGTAGEHYEVRLHAEGDDAGADALLTALADADGNTRLDRWVILEATKQLAVQRQQGNDTRLLINLTDQVLRDASLLPWLGVALKAGGQPVEALIFQCQADTAATATEAVLAFADAVRQLGCRFSLAGFGKQEHASALLERIPVDMIHLDGELCRELQKSGNQERIRQWVSAAGERGVKVIVTEVDNAAALASFWQVGADFIQGGYLQAPAREMNYDFTDIA